MEGWTTAMHPSLHAPQGKLSGEQIVSPLNPHAVELLLAGPEDQHPL